MAAIRCRLLLPRGFCISKRVQEVQLGYGVNKLDYYLVEVIPTYVRGDMQSYSHENQKVIKYCERDC